MTTDIVYGGTTIAALDEKQSATIKCAKTQMTSDIEILFTGDGSIQYGDVETEVIAGQAVTLPCADKEMSHDLVVKLLNILYKKVVPRSRTTLMTADNQTFLMKEN